MVQTFCNTPSKSASTDKEQAWVYQDLIVQNLEAMWSGGDDLESYRT